MLDYGEDEEIRAIESSRLPRGETVLDDLFWNLRLVLVVPAAAAVVVASSRGILW